MFYYVKGTAFHHLTALNNRRKLRVSVCSLSMHLLLALSDKYNNDLRFFAHIALMPGKVNGFLPERLLRRLLWLPLARFYRRLIKMRKVAVVASMVRGIYDAPPLTPGAWA